jgi:hypothetical protein
MAIEGTYHPLYHREVYDQILPEINKVFEVLDPACLPKELINLVLRYSLFPPRFLDLIVDEKKGLGKILRQVLLPSKGSLIDQCLALPKLHRWELVTPIERMRDAQGQLQPVMLSILVQSERLWVPQLHFLEDRAPATLSERFVVVSLLPIPFFMKGDTHPIYATFSFEYDLQFNEQGHKYVCSSSPLSELPEDDEDGVFYGQNVVGANRAAFAALKTCWPLENLLHFVPSGSPLGTGFKTMYETVKQGDSVDPNEYFHFDRPNAAPLQLGLEGIGDELPPGLQAPK